MPSSSDFTVSTVLAGPWAVVTPAGEIDVDSAPDLERALDDCLDHHPSEVHVDLYAVRFCDCRGLGTLLRAQRRAHTLGAALVLHDPAPVVARLLAVSGTDGVLGPPVAA
ncbi:STAS domain-containing protein [Embleya sp. NBC_00896]|uniref:STAS domain-containing protein n=1 Tax=Embleya sp. NBC_00896 TaxID=2975961 RepID=UPI002F907125|nr:STAS domain-containing protein [Embleya sp. NBC_00896]